MSTRTIDISDQLYDYMLSVSVPSDPLWERLQKETIEVAGFNMQISPEQGQFMSVLMPLLGVKKIIEVGTFTGYSALCMARALPDEGRLIACDISHEWTTVGERYWAEAGVAHKIDLKIAPALETLDALLADGQAGKFDFAFIDADKERYADYYECCLALLRPGGAIGIDNTLWGGSVVDESNQEPDTIAIRAFNQKVFEDARVNACLVPIGDGFTLAHKR